ncbi:Glutathione S-transferase 2 [Zalaria obscura]|uniref:Glutathione S-transferase 2 n=1 Tax=Zalaria obscura TaxID=2024903 RepID=A0ACC3SH33_9PEZI
MSAKQPDITLYTAATPNGVKISIMLEELGEFYEVCWTLPLPNGVDSPAITMRGRDAHMLENDKQHPLWSSTSICPPSLMPLMSDFDAGEIRRILRRRDLAGLARLETSGPLAFRCGRRYTNHMLEIYP